MDIPHLVEWTIEAIVIVIGLVGGFAYLTLLERRVLARIQVLQPVADGIKLIFKEELIPDRADKILFILAPVITVVPALIVLAVVPLGPDIVIFGHNVTLGLAGDINVGVLYIMAVSSIAVYGITIAGWSSSNKYALLGGLRATAQMISYELALGLAFVGPILLANSMSLTDIVNAQQGFRWFILLQPLGFIIFMLAGIAEVNRDPFDMPEAEQELTAGYHAEYSGMKFALMFMAEYDKMIAVSMIAATLFLGGFGGPFVDQFPLLGPVYLIIKTVFLLLIMIWMRATLVRFRYDRLMEFGWKILLPLALLNVVATAVFVLVGG